MTTPKSPAMVEVDRLPKGRTHELKCWPGPFDAMARGLKTFEFRKNDRDYQVGDALRLRRFQPIGQQYTGEVMEKIVTHILRNGFGLPDGYCVMSLDTAAEAIAAGRAEVVRLSAECEKLRAALEPFANIAFFPNIVDGMVVTLDSHEQQTALLKAFANARAALATPTQGG